MKTLRALCGLDWANCLARAASERERCLRAAMHVLLRFFEGFCPLATVLLMLSGPKNHTDGAGPDRVFCTEPVLHGRQHEHQKLRPHF